MSTIKTSSDKTSPLLIFSLLASVALLITAGYLFYQNNQLSKSLESTSAQLSETEMLRKEVEESYDAALGDLESMRGENAELNALIDQQTAELESSKKQVEGLLVDSRNLSRVRKELNELKSRTEGYLAEINQLKEENGLLAESNTRLSTENASLQQDLGQATAANEELTTAQAALLTEKDALTTERNELAGKVTMGSVVKVNNVEITGLHMRSNGKTVRKKYAKNVDLLDICFETSKNELTEAGDELYHVRVISPTGETLAIEEMGSGILTNNLTGEQVRYTKAASKAYANDVSEVCIQWDTPTQLASGDYTVEVYNKGFLAGTGDFRLK